MRALVLNDDGVDIQMNRPGPVPLAGEVLVRVLCAGMCETDLQLIRGYEGFSCSCRACDTCLAGGPGH